MNRVATLLGLAFVLVGCSRPAKPPEPAASGIVQYTYDPNPQEPAPKLYNWEVVLSKTDSSSGKYEIVQITRPMWEDAAAGVAAIEVLVDDSTVVPNHEGRIHFDLHVGDKEPTQNMNAPGNIGLPIVFSGTGTWKGSSSWIVLPGVAVEQVTPSGQGTPLSDGSLTLMAILATSSDGKKHRAEVILRRKEVPSNHRVQPDAASRNDGRDRGQE